MPTSLNVITDESFKNDVTVAFGTRISTSSSTDGHKSIDLNLPSMSVTQYASSVSIYATAYGQDAKIEQDDDGVTVTYTTKDGVYVNIRFRK